MEEGMVSERVKVSAPQAIEQTLTELRQAALEISGGTMPPVRAIVLNLVAYVGTRSRAEEVADQVKTLSEQHPMRAIVLGTEPERAPDGWDIQVWAHCHPILPGLAVCVEAVQIMSQPQALERVPAIALSLLLRDLPVVLWWPGDPAIGTALFERLMADADRLVVDTATATDPEAMLRRLSALSHAEHCQCILSDLNWSRLTPWREITAQFFDPSNCRPCLERLERMTIEYLARQGSGVPAQAHLLAAWMATRLGWAPAPVTWTEADGSSQAHLLHGRRPITIRFVPLSQPDAAAPAAAGDCLRRLALEADHPEGRAAFSIERTAGAHHARVAVALPSRPYQERTVPLPLPTTTGLLSEELRRPGYDLIYQETLRMAAYLAARRVNGAR